tara:strand:+ start:63 stop:524 length:462 start_codon:yes stop_codon:yes gene_type:complete
MGPAIGVGAIIAFAAAATGAAAAYPIGPAPAHPPLGGVRKSAFKRAKSRFSLRPYVQIHHIIPRELRHHIAREGFDLEDGQNFMFMPNALGKQHLATRRPNHQGGHQRYNKYVRARLDGIATMPSSERQAALCTLALFLRQELRRGGGDVPWK